MLDPDKKARLQRLLAYLRSDPTNATLVTDAASLAYDGGHYELCRKLMENIPEPLPPGLANVKGLIALQEQNPAEAEEIFESLRGHAAETPALRFNLAWVKARLDKWREALDLLDDAAVAAAPRGPSLKIHTLHHLGLYAEALAAGEELAKRFPDDQALMGALATLSMDAERTDLAEHYAKRAGTNAEGEAALGFLELGKQDADRSLALFESAIAAAPHNPRAWVGKGLGLLATGRPEAAAKAMDQGAEIFQDHLGSWIASGWAYFIAGDLNTARARFEHALTLDDTFSEAHGGLAVLDIAEGHLAEAERRSQVALRLDRNSLGATLAKTMLLEKSGRADVAQRIRQTALSVPIGPNGQTIAQALAGFARRQTELQRRKA